MIKGILPSIVLVLTGLFLLLLRLFKIKKDWIAFFLSFASLIFAIFFIPLSSSKENFPTIIQDELSIFFQLLISISSLLTLILSWDYIRKGKWGFVEYSSLILFSTTGMFFMVTSKDFLTLYIGLELMALSSYVLTGYARGQIKAFEASFKYFILGTFSSAVLLYGISLIYGTTGNFLIENLMENFKNDFIFKAGMVLVLCGFLFKVAAIPFHIWTPDVYEGAPDPITAFFSIGPKAASFAAFIRIFWWIFFPAKNEWQILLYLISMITMIGGNLMAIVQNNVKRMLAYASIGSAGYVMLGFISKNEFSLKGIFYYLLAFLFSIIGVFTIIIYLNKKEYSSETVEDFKGLNKKHPFIAFSMLVFLLSLVGIPGTAGFVGKFFLFGSAIKGGFISLAVVGVLTSVISLFYFFRIIVNIYMGEGDFESLNKSPSLNISLIISLISTLFLGFYPSILLEYLKIDI